MYFSITFGEEPNVRNTWDDWHLIPKSRPLVSPPEVKTEYIDVPGMDGSLDYTGILSGIKFKDREGNWEFNVENDHQEWYTLYKDILNFLNGQRLKVKLESDPGYYYYGRFFIDDWDSSSSEGFSSLNIRYIIAPYKYPVRGTGSNDWLWNELQFVNIYEIYYGRFTVSGESTRNLINPKQSTVAPKFTCSSAMTVSFNGTTYALSQGYNENSGIELSHGDNEMTFFGNGNVIVDYDTGRTL